MRAQNHLSGTDQVVALQAIVRSQAFCSTASKERVPLTDRVNTSTPIKTPRPEKKSGTPLSKTPSTPAPISKQPPASARKLPTPVAKSQHLLEVHQARPFTLPLPNDYRPRLEVRTPRACLQCKFQVALLRLRQSKKIPIISLKPWMPTSSSRPVMMVK